jgi:SAM-dependent methyltransferase
MLTPVYDPRWYARIYDRLGATYLELPFTQGTIQEVAFLVEELALAPGMRVLDAGCGAGRHAIELAALGCSVTGVDLSARLLEIGLELARSRQALVNFVHTDVRDLRYEQMFDVALSLCEGAFGILESDAENRRVLVRLHAALKPGGLLAINALNRGYLETRPETFPGHDRESGWTEHEEGLRYEGGRSATVIIKDRAFTAEEMSLLLGEVGFAPVAIYGVSTGDFGRHALDASRMEMLAIARKS